MKARRLAIAAAALAIAIGAFLWMRSDRDAHRPATPTAAAPIDAPVRAAPGNAAPTAAAPRLHRFADATERDRLSTAIRIARARREQGAAAGGTATATTSPSPPPALTAPMTADDMLASLMAVVPLLQECYTQARPRLRGGGQVAVGMTLSGEPDVGTLIDDATLASDDGLTQDADFTQCLHETLMSIELPPLPAGGSQAFSITVEFADDDNDGGAPAADAR